VTYVLDELEEHDLGSDRKHAAETDKAWDAIHRALTDGTLSHHDPKYHYGHVILGGESLYSEDDYAALLETGISRRAVRCTHRRPIKPATW
jgi:hypothetical protein